MRSVEVERYGGPDEMRIVETPIPQPGRGEVLVQLALAGVNFIDIYMRDGSYARSHTYQTPLPMRLGMEGAGTVAAPTFTGSATGQQAFAEVTATTNLSALTFEFVVEGVPL